MTRPASPILKTLWFVSIVCAALALGLTLAHVLERPGKLHLSGAEWLAVQHTFYGDFVIVGGIAEVLGLLSSLGILALVRHRRITAALVLIGALGFAGMLLSFAFGNRPIDDAIATWTPATLPADWAEFRDQWDDAHALSAAFAAVSLASLLFGLVRDAPAGASSATNRSAVEVKSTEMPARPR
ncbi:MAG: hypothetical protein IT305_28765 [Chloroflexi bacterium]|nr:hypothetical protein [Chloroflexota bacterium]